jgi:hypothetical protein
MSSRGTCRKLIEWLSAALDATKNGGVTGDASPVRPMLIGRVETDQAKFRKPHTYACHPTRLRSAVI